MTCWLMLLLYKMVIVVCEVTRLYVVVVVSQIEVVVLSQIEVVVSQIEVEVVLIEMEVVLYHK